MIGSDTGASGEICSFKHMWVTVSVSHVGSCKWQVTKIWCPTCERLTDICEFLYRNHHIQFNWSLFLRVWLTMSIGSGNGLAPYWWHVFIWVSDDLIHWCIWVRSRNYGCFVTWFCYQLIAKPGNKTAAVSWPDPNVHHQASMIYIEDYIYGTNVYRYYSSHLYLLTFIPKLQFSTVEVWEWINYFMPHFAMDVITYPCWD